MIESIQNLIRTARLDPKPDIQRGTERWLHRLVRRVQGRHQVPHHQRAGGQFRHGCGSLVEGDDGGETRFPGEQE